VIVLLENPLEIDNNLG